MSGLRSIARLIAPLMLLAGLGACSALGDPHVRGQKALEQGDYGTAVKAYTQIIDAGGDHLVEAYTNRGIASEAMRNYDVAIADYGRALDAAPDEATRAEILNNRGVAYLGKRQTAEAIADFEAAIEIDPDYAEALANLGRAKVDREEWEAAIEDLSHALEIDADLAEAYGNRALAHESLGEDELATRDYSEAIRLSQDPQAYFNRGMLRYTLGCFDLAFDDFTAVTERLDDSEYLYYMAESQRQFLEGRPAGADSCLGVESEGALDADEAVDTEGAADDAAADDAAADEAAPDEAAPDDASESGSGSEDEG